MTTNDIPVTVPARELDDPKPSRRFPNDARPTCCHCWDSLTQWAYNTYTREWELWSEHGRYVNVCPSNPNPDSNAHEIKEEG